MSDKESLVELLRNFTIEREIIDNHDNVKGFETFKVVAKYCELYLADHLIANGVTVQKHGRWENTRFLTTGDGRVRVGDCSSCKSIERVTRYCPNCGAKMDADA